MKAILFKHNEVSSFNPCIVFNGIDDIHCTADTFNFGRLSKTTVSISVLTNIYENVNSRYLLASMVNSIRAGKYEIIRGLCTPVDKLPKHEVFRMENLEFTSDESTILSVEPVDIINQINTLLQSAK